MGKGRWSQTAIFKKVSYLGSTDKYRSPDPAKNRSIPTDDSSTLVQNDIVVRISLGTYKIFYEAGTEDFIQRKWDKEQSERLGERVKRRPKKD